MRNAKHYTQSNIIYIAKIYLLHVTKNIIGFSMDEYNYIIREDNDGMIISMDGMLDAIDIEETLKGNTLTSLNPCKKNLTTFEQITALFLRK